MELAAQLEERRAELFLDWFPRGVNREADSLADGVWDGFDANLRVHSALGGVKWLVLPELLAAGRKFYTRRKKAARAKQQPTGAGMPGEAKMRKLREREPW